MSRARPRSVRLVVRAALSAALSAALLSGVVPALGGAVTGAVGPVSAHAQDDVDPVGTPTSTEMTVDATTARFDVSMAGHRDGWTPRWISVTWKGAPTAGVSDLWEVVGSVEARYVRSIAAPDGCASACTTQVELPRASLLATSRVLVEVVYENPAHAYAERRWVREHLVGENRAALRPAAVMTAPVDNTAVWGPITLRADASAAPGGAPLHGVRFVSPAFPRLFDGAPEYVDTVPPYEVTVTVPNAERFEVYAVAEATDGALSPRVLAGHAAPSSWRWLPTDRPAELTDPIEPSFRIDPQVVSGTDSSFVVHADAGRHAGGRDRMLNSVEVLDAAGQVHATSPALGGRSATLTLDAPALQGGGWHEVTVRMRIASTGVSTTKARLFSSGEAAAPVLTVNGKAPHRTWATAGERVRLRAVHRAALPGDVVRQWRGLDPDNRTVPGTSGTCGPVPDGCAATAVSEWVWTVPKKVRSSTSHVVRVETATASSTPSLFQHPVRVRAAGQVKSAKVKPVVSGKRAVVRGAVTLRHLGDRVARSRTALQYRPRGGEWRTVVRVTSRHDGSVVARTKVKRSGHFRWVLADAGAKHSGATSKPVAVTVRRR